MKIVALREKVKHEIRVAITPEVASLLVKKGFAVTVEKDIGVYAGFLDEEYSSRC